MCLFHDVLGCEHECLLMCTKIICDVAHVLAYVIRSQPGNVMVNIVLGLGP